MKVFRLEKDGSPSIQLGIAESSSDLNISQEFIQAKLEEGYVGVEVNYMEPVEAPKTNEQIIVEALSHLSEEELTTLINNLLNR